MVWWSVNLLKGKTHKSLYMSEKIQLKIITIVVVGDNVCCGYSLEKPQ